MNQLSNLIKQKALELGFSACGIARAEAVDDVAIGEMEEWLAKGYAAGMDYMHRNKSLRYDPRELFAGAKSLIVVAMNYYPREFLKTDIQFSCYAYGKDYHFVMKKYLGLLYEYLVECAEDSLGKVEGRAFVDSAPIMERYWAEKAGVGFRGRNGMIIVPKVGSFCFLGVLAVNIPLAYDKPLEVSCGKCHRCEVACPTCAISDKMLDANKCISYQTIENRTDTIPKDVSTVMGNWVYGCDICQLTCPWNVRFAKHTVFAEFYPSEEFERLDMAKIEKMTNGTFKKLFSDTPILRIGKRNIQRNVSFSKKSDG